VLIAALAAVYYLAAKLGLNLAFTTPSVTAVWAPTGIALAAVLLWGYRIWPGVALGAFLANAWTDIPLYTTLGITAGNTLEALAGAYLLKRFTDFRPSLDRVRDVAALALLAAVVSTIVSATIGVASLLAGGEIDTDELASTWRTWWLGDMGGDLVLASAILVAVTHWPYRRAPGRVAEAVALGLVVGGVAAVCFTNEASLTFLTLPPLIAVALRFWQPGAVAATLIVAAIAIPLTEAGQGPFAGNTPDERLLLAQAFVGVYGLTGLVLAAVISERARAQRTLAQIAGTLQESLLPSVLPSMPGFDAAVDYRPAAEGQIVGGDFYDVSPGDDGSWAVVVGDVLGKDASAAATTALARYTLRAAAVHERRPSRILAELNTAIRRQAPDQLCTAVYSRVAIDAAGTGRVVLSRAGHPPPLVLRADGRVERTNRPTLILGMEPDPTFVDETVDLARGEALVYYTDGLTDAHAPGRVLRIEDVANALRGCTGLDAIAITRRLTDALLDPTAGEPRDDILVLVLRLPGAPA
jgi:integral membrane sensor domain MASE1